MKNNKRDKQTTPYSSPAGRRVQEATPWRHIISTSLDHAAGVICTLRARVDYFPTEPPTLVCHCVNIERHNGMARDIAREVGLIPHRDDVVVDQSVVGESGARFFKDLAPRASTFVPVEITDSKDKELYRGDLVNGLIAAFQGEIGGERIEVTIPKDLPGAATLMAEIKSAPGAEELSQLFRSIALAIWRACNVRRRIERSDRPPPRVLLGYPEYKRRPS